MATYIHQLPDWPQFRWDPEVLAGPLAEVRHRQGRLLGRMESLGFMLQKKAELETLTLEVLKSSEIEGEKLDAAQVRSSIARRLGIEIAGMVAAERDVEGVVEMMARRHAELRGAVDRSRLGVLPAGRQPARIGRMGAV